MSLQYTHLLIPGSADFAPEPVRVVAFLQSLVDLGAAPTEATLKAGKHNGRVRTGTDSLTGEKVSIPVRDFQTLENLSALANGIVGIEDYDVHLVGKEPQKLKPFAVFATVDGKEAEFLEPFAYAIACRQRKEPVSLSESDFGRPCVSKDQAGVFHPPNSNSTVAVLNGGCARFWIEFELGKWLYPRIGKDLEFIHPEILVASEKCLGTEFVQGCLYG